MTIVAAERAREILRAETNPGTAMAMQIVLEAARLAAEQSDATAQFNLGNMYADAV